MEKPYTLRVMPGHLGQRCIERSITQWHITEAFEKGVIIEGRGRGLKDGGTHAAPSKEGCFRTFQQDWRIYDKVVVHHQMGNRVLHMVALIEGNMVALKTVIVADEQGGFEAPDYKVRVRTASERSKLQKGALGASLS